MVRVLVCGDNRLSGKLVEYCLGRHGWEVESHIFGSTMLNRVDEFQPDVVLLDFEAPALSKSSTMTVLADKKASVKYKLVFMSRDENLIRENLFQPGLADGYFVKKDVLDGLKDYIEKVLGEQDTAV